MADISKIKLANGTTVDIKDATGRSNLSTLLGSHALEALKTAAWKDAQDTWNAEEGHTGELPSVAAVKSYVDAQIEAIPTFECVVCPADAAQIPAGAKYYDKSTTPVTEITGTMAASASTYKKIYLVKNDNAGAGAYVEYLTIRSGSEGSYTYAWEQIGTTVVDLSGYVRKTQKVAGIDLQDDITVAELSGADSLNLKALAHKDSASASYTPAGSISEVDATPAGEVTINDLTQTSTVATISTKADYTPAGSLLVDAAAQAAGNKVLKGGSINVTIKDADAATAVTDITYDAYTPAGSVALTKDNESGTFQVSGTVAAPTITVDDSAKDTFVKSLKAGTTDAASFTEGAFTAASYDDGFLSAGAQASFTQGAKAALTDQSKSKFAAKMPKAVTGTGEDAETLMFEYVDSSDTTLSSNFSDAVTDRGTFTANGDDSFTANTLQSLDSTKFHGGSKAADTFAAEKLPVVDGTASAVTGVSATSSAPAFTGDKFAPAFTGTEANVKFAGAKYLKQEINAATFSGTEAALTFSGTKSEQLIPTEVKYDKATANGASFAGTTNKITPTFSGTAATITVE